MKNKLLIALVVTLLLVTMTGCKNKEKEKEPVVEVTEVEEYVPDNRPVEIVSSGNVKPPDKQRISDKFKDKDVSIGFSINKKTGIYVYYSDDTADNKGDTGYIEVKTHNGDLYLSSWGLSIFDTGIRFDEEKDMYMKVVNKKKVYMEPVWMDKEDYMAATELEKIGYTVEVEPNSELVHIYKLR